MPSELPMFGTPSRGTLVCVPRQSIFSSAVISDSRLSMRLSAGRFGSLKGYFVCENAGITRRIEVQIRSRWRVFILAQLSHRCAVVQHAGWNRPKPITPNRLICPRTQAVMTNASRIPWAASGSALYHRWLDSVLGGLLHETDEVLDCPLRRAADRFQRKTPDRRH